MPVLFFGFLLVVLSGSLAGLLVMGNLSVGQSYTVTFLGQPLAAATPVEIFAAGAACTLVFCLGIQLCVSAIRRRMRMQAEFEDMEEKASALTAERDRLAAQLQSERTARLDAETLSSYPSSASYPSSTTGGHVRPYSESRTAFPESGAR